MLSEQAQGRQNTDRNQRLEFKIRLPKNSTFLEADATFAQVEKSILAHKAQWKIKSVTSWFQPTGGEMSIFLETGERVDQEAFFTRLRSVLPRLPGVTYRLGFEDFVRDEGGQRLRLFVTGNDLKRLEELGSLVRAELEDRKLFPELTEVDE